MSQYEIEIKVLLWEKEKADKFKEDIKRDFSWIELVWTNSQLNHYFVWGDLKKLKEILKDKWLLNRESSVLSYDKMLEEWKSFSVRTRFVDKKSILVIKFSVDDTTSDNWTARREWEEIFDLKIEELDNILIDSWFEYQAKWSREREEYKIDNINICLDKNAWYWYLAEFEMILDSHQEVEESKDFLRKTIELLWYEELDQTRLERMFAYYNNNWRDYYGTDKTFVIE